jgi:acetyl-CoA synthetase
VLKDFYGARVEPVKMPAEAPLFPDVHQRHHRQAQGLPAQHRRLPGLRAGTSKYVQDIHPEDVYWCMADIGWITGHSYIVYGPLAICASTVIYEGVPTYPDAGRSGGSPRTWTSTSSTPPRPPSAPCASSAR